MLTKCFCMILPLLLWGIAFAQQPLNRYLDSNRIYLDSRYGSGDGEFDWRMMKAGDVGESPEEISRINYNDSR